MKLSPEHIKLWKDIHKILSEDWDPIGVSGYEDWPDDEYNGYVPQIFQMRMNCSTKEQISEELFKYETVNMGLQGNKDHCIVVAQKIIDL